MLAESVDLADCTFFRFHLDDLSRNTSAALQASKREIMFHVSFQSWKISAKTLCPLSANYPFGLPGSKRLSGIWITVIESLSCKNAFIVHQVPSKAQSSNRL